MAARIAPFLFHHKVLKSFQFNIHSIFRLSEESLFENLMITYNQTIDISGTSANFLTVTKHVLISEKYKKTI